MTDNYIFQGLPKEVREERLTFSPDADGQVTIALCPPEKLVSYCWPGREFLLSAEDVQLQVERGYFFPLSFLTFVYQTCGYTLLLESDFTGLQLTKAGSELSIRLRYPAGVTEARLRICRHRPDWHEGLAAYRRWREGHLPVSAQRGTLWGHFHLKRYFFHEELCKRHAQAADGSCHLSEQWQEDRQLAGVDTLLLFDHSYRKEGNLRCGLADPLEGLSDLEGLRGQIRDIQEQGGKVFAYFDPYLVDEGSDMAEKQGRKAAIKGADGEIARIWGASSWHPCLTLASWQRDSAAYIRRIVRKLPVDGIYLDELGNGTQYHCHDQSHNHPDFRQTEAEAAYARGCLQTAPGRLSMCEFPPVDRMAGQFSAVLNDSASLLDIYRFAMPEIKCFRVINCDYPLGHNSFAVNRAFFNGEGLWLDNDLENEEWYPADILRRIKAQYEVLKKYAGYFEAEENYPLEGGGPILINRFGPFHDCLLTAINATDKEQETLLLNPRKYQALYLGEGCRLQAEGSVCRLILAPKEVAAISAKE